MPRKILLKKMTFLIGVFIIFHVSVEMCVRLCNDASKRSERDVQVALFVTLHGASSPSEQSQSGRLDSSPHTSVSLYLGHYCVIQRAGTICRSHPTHSNYKGTTATVPETPAI